MGFFDELLGNASEVNIEELRTEYAKILTTNEEIEKAYKVVRDLFIFTNKRLILVDVQGLTGKKIEYQSIPYKNINALIPNKIVKSIKMDSPRLRYQKN